jgi:hypothetical protein
LRVSHFQDDCALAGCAKLGIRLQLHPALQLPDTRVTEDGVPVGLWLEVPETQRHRDPETQAELRLDRRARRTDAAVGERLRVGTQQDRPDLPGLQQGLPQARPLHPDGLGRGNAVVHVPHGRPPLEVPLQQQPAAHRREHACRAQGQRYLRMLVHGPARRAHPCSGGGGRVDAQRGRVAEVGVAPVGALGDGQVEPEGKLRRGDLDGRPHRAAVTTHEASGGSGRPQRGPARIHMHAGLDPQAVAHAAPDLVAHNQGVQGLVPGASRRRSQRQHRRHDRHTRAAVGVGEPLAGFVPAGGHCQNLGRAVHGQPARGGQARPGYRARVEARRVLDESAHRRRLHAGQGTADGVEHEQARRLTHRGRLGRSQQLLDQVIQLIERRRRAHTVV